MAGKTNLSESEIDKTTFFWTGLCAICHPGGGPSEYDRDGNLLYDYTTDTFGYEVLGKSAAAMSLDGDYSVLNPANGDVKLAPWNVTGVSEPDCLLCHRTDRSADLASGKNYNWIWRAATLRGRENLKDGSGNAAPAFAAAPTAAQGWFSQFVLANTPPGKPPMATTLQIDYQKGLDSGALTVKNGNQIFLTGAQVSTRPKDLACWGCHVTPDIKKRGRIWFDPEEDVHYAGLTNLTDEDPSNDLPATESRACTYCHTADMKHVIAKGNAFLGSVDNESDYQNLRTCRDCHDGAESNSLRDANAPALPTNDSIHTVQHLARLSCQACHITYKNQAADLVVDNATTGNTITYSTAEFLSADPLDPTNPDRTKWFPAFKFKEKDKDGGRRLYPVKLLLSIWWGDYDDRGTPELSDDVVQPIPLWRIRGLTKGQPLLGVTDDNGDGKPEVNRYEEILLYIQALKGTDKYGNQLAVRPALVKGGKVWIEDQANPGEILEIEYHGTGMEVESSHPFAIDHNVRDPRQAWGANGWCYQCHATRETPVFDRLILVDPFGPDEDATPHYETVRQNAGISPL